MTRISIEYLTRVILPTQIATLAKWARHRALTNTLWQYKTSLALKRDLSIDCVAPYASFPIEIRDLKESDIPLILPSRGAQLSRQEKQEVATRKRLLSHNIPRCLIAVDSTNGRPCFLQWAFGPTHNKFIQRYFKGRFPTLHAGQLLLEGAYTPPAYRGRGVMADAMYKISTLFTGTSVNEIITFVDHQNIASVKGCQKAGFLPYLVRRDYSLLHLVRHRIFKPIGTLSSPAQMHVSPPYQERSR